MSEWILTSGANSSVQICHLGRSSPEHCPDFTFAAGLKRNVTHLWAFKNIVHQLQEKNQRNRRQQLWLAGDSTGYHRIPEDFFEDALKKSYFLKSLWRFKHPTWETAASLLFLHARLEPQPGRGLQRVPKRTGRTEAVRFQQLFTKPCKWRVLSSSRCKLKLCLLQG